jgi:hypothetical protein
MTQFRIYNKKGDLAMDYKIWDICQFKLVILLLVFVMITSGCTVTLVSKYDEQTDKNVTALQQKFEAYLIRLEGESFPKCSYASNKAFYDDTKVQISSSQVRANAIPMNKITVEQLDALSKATSGLETSQKMRDDKKSCLPKEIIETDRTMFNSIFTAILKFELAKKRGDSK